MRRSRVLILAGLTALGFVFIPDLLPAGPQSALDASGLLNAGRLWVAAGAIFLGGLGTSLTPCVYPLIPITVGVFGARQANSRGHAFLLTTSYVVGMGVVFSTLGVIAALSGKAFGSALGNHWLVLGLAVFLLALAASMFGAFDLALPPSLATKLNTVGGGGVIGALLMGSVAGFLAAPCTGPVLTGVLAWVSRTQDPVLGGGLLFIYALGIGVPFFLIGVFTVRLPKGGAWMEWVKSVFGIALVALAASYLRDALPPFREAVAQAGTALGRTGGVTLAAVAGAVGILLGAVHLSFKEGKQWLPKGLGVAAVLVAFLVRTAVPAAAAAAPVVDANTPPAEFQWAMKVQLKDGETLDPFEQALAKAHKDCKPVMIDFFAEWCAACKELDKYTYVSKDVVAESQRFVNIKVDGTNENDQLDTLYARFGVQGLPTVAFVSPTGEILQEPRVAGFLPPDKFVAQMQRVAVATCSASP